MILYRRKLFSTFLLLLLAVSAINARRIDQRRPLRKRHSAKYAPLLRAQESEDDFPSTSTIVDEPPSRSTKLMLFEPSSADRAQHKRQNVQYAPLERSLESEDSVPSTRTAAAPQPSRSTKLMLLTPAAAGKALETGANSGRTFGHLLMVKSLLGSGSGIGSGGGGGGGCYGYGCGNGCYSCGGGGGGNGGNGGGGSGSYLPYIVLNAPTNVTNVNQNNLTNSLPITLTTTTTNNGGQRRVPERYNAIQPVPIPVQMPMQVYQQRESGQQLMNVGSALPAMMFGMNGELIPVLLPAGTHQIPMQVPDNSNRWRDGAGQRWRGNQNANHHNRHSNHNNHNNDNNRNNMRHGHNNPFEVLANSLKRIQYL